jgi:hypothetical protein
LTLAFCWLKAGFNKSEGTGKMTVDTSNWELVDEDFDLDPGPGGFIGKPGDYTINGELITGACSWLNALYRWLWNGLERNGNSRHHCSHCGKRVRYVAIFQDASGLHITGRDCAELIQARQADGFDRVTFYHVKLLRRIGADTQVSRNGRFYYSFECPAWFWDIAKSRRPDFARVSKYDRNNTWYLTIWADTREAVKDNYEALIALRGTPNADDGKAFVGTIGERATFNLTVDATFENDGIFGREYTVRFSDENGNPLAYKGSSNLGVEKGQKVKLTATVKAHKERNGEKTTWLNRPKVAA